MNNPQFTMNTNDNEVLMNPTESCATISEECNIGTPNNKNVATNFKENTNVLTTSKENYSKKKLFGKDKNISSSVENNSNVLSNKDLFHNESNEKNPLDIPKEDLCMKCLLTTTQHKVSPQESKATDELVSFSKDNKKIGKNNTCLKCLLGSRHKVLSQESKAIDNLISFSKDKTTIGENKSPQNNECLMSVASQDDDTFFLDGHGDKSVEVQFDKPKPLASNLNIVPNPNEFNLVGSSSKSMQNPDFLNSNQSTNEILALSDNSIVISNSNAIPQSDSIVSSNYSLSQLQQYISDDGDDDDCVIEELPVVPLQYREGVKQMEDSDDSDSSTSSSTSILISDSSSDSESDDEYENSFNKPTCKPIKAKGEFDLNDLPPIEDLTISVPEEECIPVGKIYQIVEQLVVVRANKDTPAYDLDTIMFTQGGKPLGKVFDVMGPVTEPYYCIRFNSKDHIKEKNIALDQTVYVAPKTQYSKFVFLAQLMQLKGSDASWENDVEPPEIYLDYSDDEQEQRAKKKNRNKKATFKTDSDPDEPARKRHSAYVKKMNARNLRLSAVKGNQNPNKNKAENGNILWQPNLPPMMEAFPSPLRAATPCHQMFGKPPLFDMRVPLPNSPFTSHCGPQFYHPQSRSVNPQRFSGPSTSSRAPGPSPFPRPSISPGPPPFTRPYTSSRPHPFPRPCASPGPSNGPSMQPFSPPPPYGQLSNNQGLNSPPPGWNSSFPKRDNPWASPYALPPRNGPPSLRNAPPSDIGAFPFPMDLPNRAGSPRGPHVNALPRWSAQPNNRANPPQFNFNPSVPPPSPNFFPY